MQRDPLPGHERQLPQARPWRDQVPVDDADQAPLLGDNVVGAKVVVADHQRIGRLGQLSDAPRWRLSELDIRDGVMKPPSCLGGVSKKLVRPHPAGPRLLHSDCLPFDEPKPLPATRDAERLWGQQEPSGADMSQDVMHRCRPRTGGADYDINLAIHLVDVAAAQRLGGGHHPIMTAGYTGGLGGRVPVDAGTSAIVSDPDTGAT